MPVPDFSALAGRATLKDAVEELTKTLVDVSATIEEAIEAINAGTKKLSKRIASFKPNKKEEKGEIDKAIDEIEKDLGKVVGDAFSDFGKAILDVAMGDKSRFRNLDDALKGRLKEAAKAVVENLLKGLGKSLFESLKEKLKNKVEEAGGFGKFAFELARDIARGIAQVVDRIIRGIGRGLKALADGVSAVVSGIAQALGTLIQGLTSTVSSLLGTVISGIAGAIGGLFGGGPTPPPRGFAHGGRPTVGRAALVGETGPELFIPDVPGMIVPGGLLAAGAGAPNVVTNFTIDARGAERGVERRIQQAIFQAEQHISQIVMARIINSARRGGTFARLPRR